MARPRYTASVEAAAGAEPGDHLSTGGRKTVSLYVLAESGFDPAADEVEVQLEGSFDGENFAELHWNAAGQVGVVDQADFTDPDGNGKFAALVTTSSTAIQYVRANVTTHSGGFDVTAYVGLTNNPSGAQDFREV